MGFVISQSQTYVWPVEINLPVDGGKYNKSTFDAEFARVPQTRVEELVGSIAEGVVNDREICREVIKGWRGVVDDDRSEIPFSPSMLDELLEIPTVAMSLVKAWMESLTGAKRKN